MEQASMTRYLLNRGFNGQESNTAHMAAFRSPDGLTSVLIETEEDEFSHDGQLKLVVSCPTKFNFPKRFPELVDRLTPVTDFKSIKPKK